MRKRHTIMFLAVAFLGACSGGEGARDGGPAATPTGGSVPGPTATPPLPPVERLSCSPCKKIVYTSTRDGNPEIYSVNVDGTEPTRLTDNGSYDGEPAWSPDGLRIAFISNRDLAGSSDLLYANELYVMDADGSNVERLTFSKSGAWSPAWSPMAHELRTNR